MAGHTGNYAPSPGETAKDVDGVNTVNTGDAPRKKTSMWLLIALAALIGLGLIGKAAQHFDPKPDASASTTTSTTDTAPSTTTAAAPAVTEPIYTWDRVAQDEIAVTVDQAYTQSELEWIVGQLQDRFEAADDGGYFVRFNCSTGGTETADNRLANGRFAVGRLGSAQTGLHDGEHDLTLLPEATCPKVR
jgi:hypothetical protein